MKINNSILGSTGQADSASGVRSSATDSLRKAKARDADRSGATGSARIDLSEKAQDAKRAAQIARKGLEEIDEAKVAKFQSLIDSGKYAVDAAKVADRMVDEHLSNELAARETKD